MSLKNIKELCIEYFQNEDIKRELKEIVKPIAKTIYNEIYIYIWILCFYNVVFIFIVLANLILLIKLLKRNNNTIPEKYI